MRLLGPFSPWLTRSIQIAVVIAVVVLLARSVDWRESLALLGAADPSWLLAAAAALTLQTILSALRWRMTAAQLGIDLSPGNAVREYYLSQVVNQSLPGGMVGDASRAMRARAQAGLLASGQAVLFERLAGQMGLLTILLSGLLLTLVIPAAPNWPLWLLVPVLGGLAVVVFIPISFFVAMRILGPQDHGLRRFLSAFSKAVFAPNVRGYQVTLSIATALCNIAAFAFCAAALGISLPMLAAITLIPLILFAMILPLSIGGWGFREGAAAVLFPVVGETMSEGFATSVAFGLVFLGTLLPGMLLSWVRPYLPGGGRQ